MPRTRRIALLAVLALVGGLALVGCGRGQPGTAAFVGDHRYTDREVTDIVDGIKAYLSPDRVALYRRDALSLLVANDLGRRAAKDRGFAVPASDRAAVAAEFRLPESAGWVRVVADWRAMLVAIARAVPKVDQSETDLREVYDSARTLGRLEPADESFEEFAQDLRTSPRGQVLLAIRSVLRDAARKVKVTVNPRYTPLVTYIDDLPLVLDFGDPSTVRSPSPSVPDQADEPAPN